MSDDLSRLKVCLIAGTLGQGGAERQLFYMLQALREAGCAARLLCLTRGEAWEEPIRALGVPVAWVGQSAGRGARLGAIVRELRREPAHVVQSAHFFTNTYSALAGRLLGISDIGAIRSDGLSESRVYGRVAGVLGMRLPRLLAVNSRVGMRNARRLGVSEKRLHFLPNVLDTAHFRPPPAPPEGFHLVAVGRLAPVKRFDRLLRVVARLRETAPEVRATLVGDGPLRGELEALARELKLDGALAFAGAVADPRPYLQKAHVALLCSVYEGTPNVLLEAQACGLPVVSTQVGGVEDIVREGETGLLVPPDADEEMVVARLCQAVQTLHGDAPRRAAMGERARHFMVENYSVARLPAFLAGLYARAGVKTTE